MKTYKPGTTVKGNIEAGINSSESLWTSGTPNAPEMQQLQDQHKADLAVIGGGYTGLACAYYAKKFRPEWNVVVLDAARMGSGASSRNSGVVYANYRGYEDHSPIAVRGLDRLLRFIEEEKIECSLKSISALEFHGSRKRAEKEGAFKEGARWLLADELQKNLNTSFYSNAVEQNQVYRFLDPGLLVKGHVEAAQKMGVELYEYSPVIEIEPGKQIHLKTPNGRLQADNALIATNGYTPRLGLLKSRILPLHHYTMATRPLSEEEIKGAGLDRWQIRFEMTVLPITCGLMFNSRFFVRVVLGYASFNSCHWQDIEGAERKARKIIEKRYPWLSDVEFTHGWHGLTGHTLNRKEIASSLNQENLHASVAYNGLGIMPGHNNGYLSACRITGGTDEDLDHIVKPTSHIPIFGEPFRSIIFKPGMKIMSP